MFRHEYRIIELPDFDDGTFFRVQIRPWYCPFGWFRLEKENFFSLKEQIQYDLLNNFFDDFESAKAFAIKFAHKGREAFIISDNAEKAVYLGRLP